MIVHLRAGSKYTVCCPDVRHRNVPLYGLPGSLRAQAVQLERLGGQLPPVRSTTSVKNATCVKCLMLWDAWLMLINQKPPLPSRAQARRMIKSLQARGTKK